MPASRIAVLHLAFSCTLLGIVLAASSGFTFYEYGFPQNSIITPSDYASDPRIRGLLWSPLSYGYTFFIIFFMMTISLIFGWLMMPRTISRKLFISSQVMVNGIGFVLLVILLTSCIMKALLPAEVRRYNLEYHQRHPSVRFNYDDGGSFDWTFYVVWVAICLLVVGTVLINFVRFVEVPQPDLRDVEVVVMQELAAGQGHVVDPYELPPYKQEEMTKYKETVITGADLINNDNNAGTPSL
eukprot:TRINITY_DN1153_c0_g2_i1.p1 TRINITY_DN1153_c0_g2~~TRINITY_DN1153_c0_g2_i1.p1  ORF type:complete len:241 (-),score=53.55 TRINITY_DN1153_c0_g2_i1:36-758(-)